MQIARGAIEESTNGAAPLAAVFQVSALMEGPFTSGAVIFAQLT